MITILSYRHTDTGDELFSYKHDQCVNCPPPGTYWHHGLQTFQVRDVHLEYVASIPPTARIDYTAVYTIYVTPVADPHEDEEK